VTFLASPIFYRTPFCRQVEQISPRAIPNTFDFAFRANQPASAPSDSGTKGRIVKTFGEWPKNTRDTISLSVKILTSFKPQCLGSFRFPNGLGVAYAFEIQTS
jgi:hypothetical protein